MKPKLLIIDDDEEIRTQMKWALAKEYTIHLAEDRPSALEVFRAEQPLEYDRLKASHGAGISDFTHNEYICHRPTSAADRPAKLIPVNHASTANATIPATKHHAATDCRRISTPPKASPALKNAAAPHITTENKVFISSPETKISSSSEIQKRYC